MSATAQEPRTARDGQPALSLIDCDAHHNWRGVKDILPYLPRYWADYVVESQFRALPNSPYPKGVNGGERVDARVVQFDRMARRVQLSIKALEVAEEKEAMAQYGSADSGASLGDILGAALNKAKTDKK